MNLLFMCNDLFLIGIVLALGLLEKSRDQARHLLVHISDLQCRTHLIRVPRINSGTEL